MAQGVIYKALSGFYYVRTPAGDVTCRGRGALRHDGTPPMVGDVVELDALPDGTGTVTGICPRTNCLVRPPVANIDRLVLVVSCADPAPNPLIIDKLTAIASHRQVPVLLVLSKVDLASGGQLADIYHAAGYPVWEVDSMTSSGVEPLRGQLATGLSVFCGNSGVGKSSLLNALFPELVLATGTISKKLGRGRHTTRHIELFDTGTGGYIADTPGFSAVDFLQWERMPPGELELCFPEFARHLPDCRYTGCSHTAERDCAVLAAVESGSIPQSRWQSYCAIYAELRQVKEWER